MLRTEVFTSPTHELVGISGTFSPTTSTLVVGQSESVLIDAQFIDADIAALGDMIEASGTKLTTIYVTHGHADHYLGVGRLLDRFPTARAIATAAVVGHIEKTLDAQARQWSALFGDAAVKATALPEPMDGDVIELEGAEMRVIEVGQADIYPSTVVHVPAIDVVVAGDVVYNQCHVMLGLTGPGEWGKWIESVDKVAQLEPKTIVAGHKKPDASDDDAEVMLVSTRSYISDFTELSQTAKDAEELVAEMQARYETFANPWTLAFSAQAWFARRNGG
jgi:glyoxylase-like metal-dependent hydrolase (beta-lactamase superfamily II)